MIEEIVDNTKVEEMIKLIKASGVLPPFVIARHEYLEASKYRNDLIVNTVLHTYWNTDNRYEALRKIRDYLWHND